MAQIRIDGDQIELNNVASEDTLKEILSRVGGPSGGFTGTENQANDVNKSSGIISGALRGVAGSLTDFGVAAFEGQARLSTATKSLSERFESLKGITGAVNSITQYGEGLVDTFRQLSQTGAGFSADVFEMKNAAAQARLTLTQFANVVSQNSESLAALGGNVSDGARIFSRFSDTFFSSSERYAERLGMLGMNQEEINESLMFYANLQRRTATQEMLTTQASMAAATSLAEEMDAVAKLTGKQRDEIQAEIEASQRQGQVEAKFREIEIKQGAEAAEAARASYAEALASAQKAGPDAVAALEETFVLGQARSQQAQQGLVALGGAAEELQTTMRAISADPEAAQADMDNMVRNLDAAIVERINSLDFLQTAQLGGAEGPAVAEAAAGLLENAGEFETAIQKVAQQAGLELNEREDFLQAVQLAREAVEVEQDGAATAGAELTNTIVNADQAIATFGAAINEQIVGPNGALTNFEDELRSAADNIRDLETSGTIDRSVENIANKVDEYLSGQEITGTEVPYTEAQEESRTGVEDALRQLFTEQELSKDQTENLRDTLSAFQTTIGPELASYLSQQAESSGRSIGEVAKDFVSEQDPNEVLNTLNELSPELDRDQVQTIIDAFDARPILEQWASQNLQPEQAQNQNQQNQQMSSTIGNMDVQAGNVNFSGIENNQINANAKVDEAQMNELITALENLRVNTTQSERTTAENPVNTNNDTTTDNGLAELAVEIRKLRSDLRERGALV